MRHVRLLLLCSALLTACASTPGDPGYAAGCMTARWTQRRSGGLAAYTLDVERYRTDATYRAGWDRGMDTCASGHAAGLRTILAPHVP
jgi:hypothetical protein